MAGFGKAFDEAFKPANAQAIAGAYDLIKEKIKLDQTKAEEALKATTYMHSTISLATGLKDKELASKIIKSAEDVGSANADVQKGINDHLQDLLYPKAADPIVTQMKQQAEADRQSNHIDTVENNAIARISDARKDPVIISLENQRFAASNAYNTIAKAKAEDRLPSSVEYTDTLAQLYKAKTGQAPTLDTMANLKGDTLEAKLNSWAQFASSKPVGANSKEMIDNLQSFIQDTGIQLDRGHDAAMAPHLIKPKGLPADRWEPIFHTARGLSFKDATNLVTVKNKKTGQVQRLTKKEADALVANNG